MSSSFCLSVISTQTRYAFVSYGKAGSHFSGSCSSFNISAGLYVTPMRLKSSIWVAAYLRRCQTEGIFGAVRRRGAEEAGAVFVKVAHLDGNAMLYGPAPQTVYDESRPAERLFAPASPQPVPEQSVEERLTKEIRFDPDAWIVETEDRAGRHFLELAKA